MVGYIKEVIKLLKIKDIRKKLFSIGIDITSDQIRAMEKKGLFKSTRSKSGYRQYGENQINNIVTSIMLHKIGYSLQEILENKKHLLNLLGRAVKTLS